jgi:type IV secretion system protein VirB6
MSAPADFHFYRDTFAQLNAALGTYIGDVAGNIIGSISGVAYSMLMIYVMLWGWSVLRGMISEPITDGATRIIKLAAIVGIALNLGRYNTYLSDFLWSTPDALANVVASGYSDSTSNVQFLDGLMSQIYDLGNAYWQKAGASGGIIPDIGLTVVAMAIWVAGISATAYGAFLLALSKMALSIILGVGPIFVLLLIFEGTKRFFDAWIGQALNYVILVVLTAGAIKLIFTILASLLLVAGPIAQADPQIDNAIPAILLCIIAALVMMQLPSISSALAGGVAIGTLGAVGWAYGKTTGTVSAMRPTSLKRSANRIRSDVRIAGSAIGKTVGMPAAVYRKVTGASRAEKKA